MRSVRSQIVLVIFIFLFGVSAYGQAAAKADIDEMRKRIEALEAQVTLLSQELVRMKSASAETAAVSSEKSKDMPSRLISPKASETPAAQTASAAKKDLGVDIGSARLTPYGTIYFNAFYNSHGTNNADVPLFAATSGNGNTSASLRQTRLGFRLEGAKVGRTRLGGVIEADFFGGFPGVGISENFGIVRLRLANIKLDWERTALIIGQDWMPFAPQNPVSLAAAAIPQMAAAGNNWARIPQIRIEQKLNEHVTWQGAMLAPQTGDSSTTGSFFLQPNSGSSSRVPFLQSRIAYAGKNWFSSKKAGTLGASVHYGRSSVFLGSGGVRHNANSWGVAADWNLPFSGVIAVTGEAFTGQDLGGFQAGIFQSLNTDFAFVSGVPATADGIRAIRTRGGWLQLAVTPRMAGNKLGLYGTVGIDDPNDDDLTSVVLRDWRLRNFSFAGEVIYKFTPQFQMGVELRRFKTFYRLSRHRSADHTNLAFAYLF